MNRGPYRPPQASRASPSTICQKCLQRGHYSYECKAASQERPYTARPSRTQQLLNPKLAPKLSEAVPNDLLNKYVLFYSLICTITPENKDNLKKNPRRKTGNANYDHRKGIADAQLAKKDRGRKRSRSRSPATHTSRKRSVSTSSYSSVSTISTAASASRSPSPHHHHVPSDRIATLQYSHDHPPRDITSSHTKKRRRRSMSQETEDSDAYTSQQLHHHRSPKEERNTRRRRSSRSPIERGRPRSRLPSADEEKRTRSHSTSESRERERGHGHGRGRGNGHAKRRPHSQSHSHLRSRSRPPFQRGGQENGFNGSRENGRGARPQRSALRERSLSPYSKRLALTQAMNTR